MGSGGSITESSTMSRVYCGNLPHDVKEKEIDDLFYKYGRIRDIHVVRRDRSAFAFVEYSDYRDAEDAVYGRDGYRFDGERLKCEMSKERRRDRDNGGGRGGDRGGDGGSRRRERGDRPKRERRERKPPTRAEFGVVIKGLPEGSKWRNLKEHFATAGGEVIFCDILKDSGEGLIEFNKEEEALEAIKKFDDTEYESVTIKCEQAPPKPVEEAAEAPVASEDAPAAAAEDKGDDKDEEEKKSDGA